jgi:hypothetical protein
LLGWSTSESPKDSILWYIFANAQAGIRAERLYDCGQQVEAARTNSGHRVPRCHVMD